MTTEQINSKIEKYEQELNQLVEAHNATMGQLQQTLNDNRNQFQQITGRISELKEMLPEGEIKAA
jgi:predicted DNA-binding ArsR family transcriptional regulator